MAIVVSRYRDAIFAFLVAVALTLDTSVGFVPPSPARTPMFTTTSMQQRTFMNPITPSSSFVAKARRPRTTPLLMANQDFEESAYTEAAWSAIATLVKAADFYEASNVESPILLDVLLNPSKHNAGDNAENAKRVVEKIFQKANVDLKSLRSELEKYLAKQPKVQGDAQKTMGRNLQKVLEYARDTKNVLGVSGLLAMCFLKSLVSYNHVRLSHPIIAPISSYSGCVRFNGGTCSCAL